MTTRFKIAWRAFLVIMNGGSVIYGAWFPNSCRFFLPPKSLVADNRFDHGVNVEIGIK